MHENNLVNWNALGPRGPFLFRSAGKGSKRGRFARHVGSSKIKPRSNPFGEPSQTQRLTAFQTHGKVRFCPCRARQGQKFPHEPRRMVAAGAASASRQRPAAHKDVDYENDQKPSFCMHFFLLLDVIDKLSRAVFSTALLRYQKYSKLLFSGKRSAIFESHQRQARD